VTKPVVGITFGDGERRGVHAMREDYTRSVAQAGAVPLLLATLPPQDVPLAVDRLDGLLLSGGPDVDPGLYDRKPHQRLRRVSRRRDDFELALVREALRRDLPVLAICRGQQVLNVAMGGTLVQDIASELQGAVDHDPPGERWRRSHGVEVLADTRLRAILGWGSASVNSFHHQAVDRLGDGLVVAARCPEDGVVEGLEAPAARFALAVQWHPESFWNQPDSFRCLFDAHVEACRS
jgi:putative glutamine amidotransferase